MTALSILTQRVHPAARHLIEPDALLSDLLDEIDLWGLRDDLEHEIGREISDAEMARWETVGDFADMAEQYRLGVVA